MWNTNVNYLLNVKSTLTSNLLQAQKGHILAKVQLTWSSTRRASVAGKRQSVPAWRADTGGWGGNIDRFTT